MICAQERDDRCSGGDSRRNRDRIQDIAVARKKALRFGFIRFESDKIADVPIAVKRNDVLCLRSGDDVAGEDCRLDPLVAWTHDDFRRAQLVGHGRKVRIDQERQIDVIGRTAFRNGNGHRVAILVVGGEEAECKTNVLEVVDTFYPLGLRFGLGQGRQQHASQDGDNRNHHQQFNESKGPYFQAARGMFHRTFHRAPEPVSCQHVFRNSSR